MTAIDHFNLRSFDLNHLLAFDALMQERSVTRAAARLKVGQPAMSHALSNLRLLLGDDVLVRVGQVMQPTPRAEALAAPVRALLAQTQDVLFSSDTFDPAVATREFRAGLSNEMELLLLPPLLARLRRDAPGVRLVAKVASRDALPAMLDAGTIDLAVGCLAEGPSWHRAAVLYEETHLCCFNPGLLDIEAPVCLRDYLALPHALMSLKDNLLGCLEDALARADARVNAVMSAPHLIALLATVGEAPMLATLPSRVVRRYAPQFGLAVSPVPLELLPVPVRAVWHARSDRDPGTRWLTGLVEDWARCTASGAPVG
jgi:DNA-binding transcriptional LysR family regulator